MVDDLRRPKPAPPFDPSATPLPRRRMLVLMGAGTLAATGGLGALLAACSAPPVTVQLGVDPAALVPGKPTEALFYVATGNSTLKGSAWLVKTASGDLVAFDPRCTHGLCRYRWSDTDNRFRCACHDGQFSLDGTVISGLPPRPLGRFPVRQVGNTIEVDVPGDFEPPRESLPA